MNNLESQNPSIKNNIKKIYFIEALAGMFFSVPIFVLFWQENWLSLTQIMLLQSYFAIFIVALEIPTWYYADLHGRKKSIIISAITLFFAMITYSLWHNFFHFLVAETLFAFSVSFSSGALSALVYDTLQDLWQEKSYKKIWWNIMFYQTLALSFANVIGWFIAKYDLRYTLYASIPFMLVMIPITFFLSEPQRHKTIIKEWYLKELFNILKIALVENKKLRWIIVYSGIIYAFNWSALWFYQPYFKITWLDIAYFGIVFACFQLFSAFSSKYAHILEEKIWEKYSLYMLVILVSISYLLMSNFIFLFSFSFCFIQQFVRWYRSTVINEYVNKLTTSNIRATVLSAESFIGRLIYAIILPVFWWIADVYTLIQALTVIWITSIVSGIIILLFLRKDKVI